MSLKDKVFVVTGGGNGIGREVVLNLLRRGSKVAAIDISRDALLETKELANTKSNELRLKQIDHKPYNFKTIIMKDSVINTYMWHNY